MLAPVTSFATASLAELAEALDKVAADPLGQEQRPAAAEGARSWVRPFAVAWVPAPALAPRPAAAVGKPGQSGWRSRQPGHAQAEQLRAALAAAGIGDGTLICPSPEHDTAQAGMLLDGARAALAAGGRWRRCPAWPGCGGPGQDPAS